MNRTPKWCSFARVFWLHFTCELRKFAQKICEVILVPWQTKRGMPRFLSWTSHEGPPVPARLDCFEILLRFLTLPAEKPAAH